MGKRYLLNLSVHLFDNNTEDVLEAENGGFVHKDGRRFTPIVYWDVDYTRCTERKETDPDFCDMSDHAVEESIDLYIDDIYRSIEED